MIKDFLKSMFKTATECLVFGLIIVIVMLVAYAGAEFIFHSFH